MCSAPDVSVVNSSVSGHEGGNISVQCFYSSGYQNEVKQWCRYKDQSCYTVGRTDTSQNPSVQISDDDDDGRRSFTVLMTGLRRTDSGWYFCSVGEALNPVHLTVTEAKPDKDKDTSVFKHLPSLLSELFCILSAFCCHAISSIHFYSNNPFLIALDFSSLFFLCFFFFAEENQDITRIIIIIIQLKSMTNHNGTTPV